MQKILLALNAQDINASSTRFASYIANLTNSKVTGVLLQNNLRETAFSEENHFKKPAFISSEIMNKNAELFKNICLKSDARCSVCYLEGKLLDEMIHESLFADIIITDGGTSFPGEESYGWPSEFVTGLLTQSECPVIIAPFSFDEIDEIIFTYDRTESSIFAMKQFTYIFPQFAETKITLLEVLPEEDSEITEKEKLQEWLMMHYKAVHLETLHGNPETELFKTFLAQKNKFVVMGAYGRKRFFRRSTADILLKTADIALFITHY